MTCGARDPIFSVACSPTKSIVDGSGFRYSQRSLAGVPLAYRKRPSELTC